jgi:hypothetical protein
MIWECITAIYGSLLCRNWSLKDCSFFPYASEFYQTQLLTLFFLAAALSNMPNKAKGLPSVSSYVGVMLVHSICTFSIA